MLPKGNYIRLIHDMRFMGEDWGRGPSPHGKRCMNFSLLKFVPITITYMRPKLRIQALQRIERLTEEENRTDVPISSQLKILPLVASIQSRVIDSRKKQVNEILQ
jgi:hypothetical protein